MIDEKYEQMTAKELNDAIGDQRYLVEMLDKFQERYGKCWIGEAERRAQAHWDKVGFPNGMADVMSDYIAGHIDDKELKEHKRMNGTYNALINRRTRRWQLMMDIYNAELVRLYWLEDLLEKKIYNEKRAATARQKCALKTGWGYDPRKIRSKYNQPRPKKDSREDS